MNWYPPCWEVTTPDSTAVTITSGMLPTPIDWSWFTMSRQATFPVASATADCQVSMVI